MRSYEISENGLKSNLTKTDTPRLQHLAAVARKIHLSLLFSFPEPPLSQD
jgi:hypothetical protein